jgi:hypothetical protein
MRPSTTESLLCLRRVLADVVRPVVDDDYARTQLDHAHLALEDLARRWADEIPCLMQAVDELTKISTDARSLIVDLSASPECRGVLAALDDALAIACRPAPRYPSYGDLLERHLALRSAAETLIPFLAHNTVASESDSLRQRLRRYMRGQVDRST